MENTIQLNEINEVDLGDDILIADHILGSGVASSTPDELVVVESMDGDKEGDGDGTGSMSGAGAEGRAGGEGGFAAFQKKERQKTSKV
jgi:hypothetical protein